MALSGFPNQIKVELGSAWKALAPNGLAPGTEIILTKNNSVDEWYEDTNGSTTPNTTTNRLSFKPDISGAPFTGRKGAFIRAVNTTGLWIPTSFGAYAVAVAALATTTTYVFREIFTATAGVTNNWFGLYNAGFIKSGSLSASYSGGMFSTFEEYSPAQLAPDKSTYHYG